jgi:bifunctional non-homologous end joining protein LigD
MALEEYRKKRRFDVTPEPKGKKRPRVRRKGLAFVVQKHRATALHYDFRLEWKGVMLSWAVPKGPSYDTSVKRLAMHVEDHPLEYNEFEGIIPEDEYGGGTVMIWDRGTWTPEKPDVDAGLAKGELKFTLEGKKLRGGWVLVRTRRGGDGSRSAWLLIKHRDEWAGKVDVAEEAPRSVVSNRLLCEIARDEGGDIIKAAEGDPPALLREILENPKLASPPKKGRKKAVWHSNKTSTRSSRRRLASSSPRGMS